MRGRRGKGRLRSYERCGGVEGKLGTGGNEGIMGRWLEVFTTSAERDIKGHRDGKTEPQTSHTIMKYEHRLYA
jgi:hypothetical protein